LSDASDRAMDVAFHARLTCIMIVNLIDLVGGPWAPPDKEHIKRSGWAADARLWAPPPFSM